MIKELEKQKIEMEIGRQIGYNSMTRNGASDNAKEWFRRPAYSVPEKKGETCS